MHVLGLAVPVDGGIPEGPTETAPALSGRDGSGRKPVPTPGGIPGNVQQNRTAPSGTRPRQKRAEGKFLRKRAGVKQMELFHSPDVAQAQGRPGFFPESQQVGVSQVFHQGGSASGTERFIIVNFRHVDTVGVQMPGCGDKESLSARSFPHWMPMHVRPPKWMRTIVRPEAPKARGRKSS